MGPKHLRLPGHPRPGRRPRRVRVGPRIAAALAIAAVVGLGAAGAAAAAPLGSWVAETPAPLSSALRIARDPQVAVGPDGTTTLTWWSDDLSHREVYVATRRAGSAAFGAPVLLDTSDGLFADQHPRYRAYYVDTGSGDRWIPHAEDVSWTPNPQIAVGPDGATTVTWTRFANDPTGAETPTTVIRAATRAAVAKRFGAAFDVSDPALISFGPRIAIGPDGRTTIAWDWEKSGGFGDDMVLGVQWNPLVATREDGARSFGAPEELGSETQLLPHAQVAIGTDGTTAVVWRNRGAADVPDGDVLRIAVRPGAATGFDDTCTAIRPAAGCFVVASDATLNDEGDEVAPQVAVGPDGGITAVWTRCSDADCVTFPGDPTIPAVRVATRAAGSGTFAAPATLSDPTRRSSGAQVAIAPDGATTAVWLEESGSGTVVRAATRASGAADFAPAVDVSAVDRVAAQPHIAIGRDGTTTIVWRAADATGRSIIQAATRQPGDASFDAPADLATADADAAPAQIAAGGDDTFTAAWTNADGLGWPRIQAATNGPPQPLRVALDGSGRVTASAPALDCRSACRTMASYLSTPALAPTAAAGWVFSGWGGACRGRRACRPVMTAPRDVTATFLHAIDDRAIAVSGTRTGAPITISFPAVAGAVYRIVSGGARGSCAIAGSRSGGRRIVTCAIRLRHAGRATVAITPLLHGVAGTRVVRRIAVTAGGPLPEHVTG